MFKGLNYWWLIKCKTNNLANDSYEHITMGLINNCFV